MIAETEVIKNLISSEIPTIVMHRVNYANKRGYIHEPETFDNKEDFKVYSGLTGAMNSSSMKGDINNVRLNKWRDKMINQLGGLEQQEQYLDSLADFGTLLHEALVDIWKNKGFDFDAQAEYARGYFILSAKRLGIETSDHVLNSQVFDFQKNVSSLMQFLHDEVEEIKAVESMAVCERLRIATPLDLVCRLKGKKHLTSINLKTSSQIGEEHLKQASMEFMMWNETYPEYKVEDTGIWRPKDWMEKKGVPTYEIKLINGDDVKHRYERVSKLMQIALDDPDTSYANFPTTRKVFTGKINLGEAPKINYPSIFA